MPTGMMMESGPNFTIVLSQVMLAYMLAVHLATSMIVGAVAAQYFAKDFFRWFGISMGTGAGVAFLILLTRYIGKLSDPVPERPPGRSPGGETIEVE